MPRKAKTLTRSQRAICQYADLVELHAVAAQFYAQLGDHIDAAAERNHTAHCAMTAFKISRQEYQS